MVEHFVVEIFNMLLSFLDWTVDIFNLVDGWGMFLAAFVIFCLYRFVLRPILGNAQLQLGSDHAIEEEVITGLESGRKRD